jgi:MoaA/NifB/PqqE/SkfB family radical SAM enzyme
MKRQHYEIAEVVASIPSTKMALDFIWLELTAQCNLHCIHCYADSHPGLPLEDGMTRIHWERVLSEAGEMGCESVQFIGGEVLLVPYLEGMIRHARSEGFSFIEVFTNAVLLDDSTIEFFRSQDVHIATSFYCNEPTIHEQVTKRPGSWKKTLSGIDRLKQRGISLRVGVIEMDVNRSYIADTVEFLRDRGVANVGIDHARSIGRGSVLSTKSSGIGELCGRCGNGRVCITSSGDVFPCIMSRAFPLGNVLDTSLRAAISHDALSRFRHDLAVAKSIDQIESPSNCTPDCWPHGGCSPHDICRPNK